MDSKNSERKRKTTVNEIDEIFNAKKKRKKTHEGTPTNDICSSSCPTIKKKRKKKTGEESQKEKKLKGSRQKEEGILNPPSGSKKKTKDGLAIYTEEELGLANAEAGGTPLCPFDCACCF